MSSTSNDSYTKKNVATNDAIKCFNNGNIDSPQRSTLSSSARTFTLLSNSNSTLPCFSSNDLTNKGVSFNSLLNYVGLELMALWIPRYPENSHNFASRYINDSTNLSSFQVFSPTGAERSRPYFAYQPEDIMQCDINRSRNLGALLFINTLFGGKITDHNLHVVKNETDDYYYFVPKRPRELFSNIMLDAYDVKLDLMDAIESDSHISWWKSLCSDYKSFREHLLCEIYTTAVRIYMTPEKLIDLVLDSVIEDLYDIKKFKAYILEIKKQALKFLFRVLDASEGELVNNYKLSNGSSIVSIFSSDINQFVYFYSSKSRVSFNDQLIEFHNNPQYYTTYLKLEVNYYATFLNLSELPTTVSESYRTIEKLMDDLKCLMKLIRNHWDTLVFFSSNQVWGYLNLVTGYLNDNSLTPHNLSFDRPFLVVLFVFGLRNNLNDLCKFLLNDDPYIAKSVINSNKYTNFYFVGLVGNSIVECLTKFENPEILTLVNSILSSRDENSTVHIYRRPRSRTLYSEDDFRRSSSLSDLSSLISINLDDQEANVGCQPPICG